MINQLIQWSLRNRLAVVLLAAVIILVGGFSALRMPIDVFPDLTAPTVTVIVEGRSMATQEMETLVTFPIETALNGATDVRRVRSATAVGIAVVWVEFEWGTDIYRARQTVAERLASLSGTLPEQADAPILAPVSSIMGEILFVALSSDSHDPLELRTLAKTKLRQRLLSVAGVSQVTPIGGEQKEYQVVLDPQLLRAFRLSVDEVAEALREGNQNASAGFLVARGEESVLRGIGRIRDSADIASTVVVTRAGRPILVGDLGIVQLGPAIRRGTAAASIRGPNWEPITRNAVIIAIQKQPAANTLEVTKEIERVLTELQAALPAGMRIDQRLFRQADFIEGSIRNTTEALLEGGGVVLAIVLLFLWSLRASLITIVAIPMSLATSILVFRIAGESINTMTLGGMAIAMGALVDDAIIDVENIVRRLRENNRLPLSEQQSSLAVILQASIEVRKSIVFATVIILLVFAPLFFLSGVEGRLLRPLGLAFCVSLAASLVTALTLTPAMSALLLPRSGFVRRQAEPVVARLLKRAYSWPLAWALRHPWSVAAPAALMLVLAIASGSRLGKNFLPEFNEGALVIGMVTLPGTSLAASDTLALRVQNALMQHPEVRSIGRRTGRADEDEHVQGVEASEFEVTLDMEAPSRLALPARSKADLLSALRQELAAIPGIQVTFGQPIGHRIDHMLSGTRANIAVKIFGPDLAILRALSRQAEALMGSVTGVVDLSAEQQIEVPEVNVEFQRESLARHGLTVKTAAEAMEAAYRGRVVGEVLDGLSTADVTVRLEQQGPADLAALGEVQVDAPVGYKVPLKAVAKIYSDLGPNLITRENVQRKTVVMCNVAGRDLESVVKDIQASLAAGLELPPGYYLEYGGQFESAVATRQRLVLLGGVIMIGIALLLYMLFPRGRDVLLILVNLPFALIGGVLGVHLAGGVLSVASIIGFISVLGIATRNGIMLMAHVLHLQEHEGVASFATAVQRGAEERLLPILMTALAAGLALIPLAVRGAQPGTEILTPMAIVILCGLCSSTLLSVLVLPALILRWGRPVAGAGLPEGALPLVNVGGGQ